MNQMNNAIVYVSDFNDRKFLFQSIKSLRFFDKDIPVFVVSDTMPCDKDVLDSLENSNTNLI